MAESGREGGRGRGAGAGRNCRGSSHVFYCTAAEDALARENELSLSFVSHTFPSNPSLSPPLFQHRGRHDMVNSVSAGCVTGGVLGLRGAFCCAPLSPAPFRPGSPDAAIPSSYQQPAPRRARWAAPASPPSPPLSTFTWDIKKPPSDVYLLNETSLSTLGCPGIGRERITPRMTQRAAESGKKDECTPAVRLVGSAVGRQCGWSAAQATLPAPPASSAAAERRPGLDRCLRTGSALSAE